MEGFTRTRCAFLEVGVGPTMIPTVGGSPSGSGHLLDSPFGVCRPAEVDKGDDAISAGVVFHVDKARVKGRSRTQRATRAHPRTRKTLKGGGPNKKGGRAHKPLGTPPQQG